MTDFSSVRRRDRPSRTSTTNGTQPAASTPTSSVPPAAAGGPPSPAAGTGCGAEGRGAGQPPTPARGDYEVGYGRPPRAHQFKPGNNANPRGRPKGSKNLATLLFEELDTKVPVPQNGRIKRYSKAQIGIRRAVNKFAETGDLKAFQAFLRFMPPVSPVAADAAPTPEREQTSASDEAMLAEFVEMIRSGGTFPFDLETDSEGAKK